MRVADSLAHSLTASSEYTVNPRTIPNESLYWLEIMQKIGLGDNNACAQLLKEVNTIIPILGSIVSKVRKKQQSVS